MATQNIILLQATEAIKPALQGLEKASESLVASQAINYMLISFIILLLVVFALVTRWLWNQIKESNNRDKTREVEDNEFKAQYLAMLKAQTDTNQQNGELIKELKQYLENNDNRELHKILIKLSEKL